MIGCTDDGPVPDAGVDAPASAADSTYSMTVTSTSSSSGFDDSGSLTINFVNGNTYTVPSNPGTHIVNASGMYSYANNGSTGTATLTSNSNHQFSVIFTNLTATSGLFVVTDAGTGGTQGGVFSLTSPIPLIAPVATN